MPFFAVNLINLIRKLNEIDWGFWVLVPVIRKLYYCSCCVDEEKN